MGLLAVFTTLFKIALAIVYENCIKIISVVVRKQMPLKISKKLEKLYQNII